MIYVLMFILGACIGSFLCCQARRLRLKETKQQRLPKRSVCLHCGRKLRWYENLPIISWCIQKGKCRRCKAKIGALEIVAEIATAVTFLLLSLALLSPAAFPVAPLFVTVFVATLVFVSSLIFLAIYDGAWGELPTVSLTISIICAIIIVILKLWSLFSLAPFSWSPILETLGSAGLFGGLYLILYLVSHGRWVGDGDWLLAAAIGLALGHPFYALCAIFAANFTATLVMYPIVKRRANHKIYFGPFLVLAYVIIVLCISLKVIP